MARSGAGVGWVRADKAANGESLSGRTERSVVCAGCVRVDFRAANNAWAA